MVIVECSIVDHGRNVWVAVRVSIVLIGIGIKDDRQTTEVVSVAKDRAPSWRVFYIPQRESVTVKLGAVAMHSEGNFNLPISRFIRHNIPYATLTTLRVLCQSDVLACDDS